MPLTTLQGLAATLPISEANVTNLVTDLTTAGAVKVASVTLTNAQVIALPTAGVQIVAAPGASRVVVPIFGYMFLTWVADYGNINATARLGIEYGTTGASTLAPLYEATAGQVSNLLIDSATHAAVLPPLGITQTVTQLSGLGQFQDEPGTVNAALNVYANNQGDGAFTLGDAGNSLKVSVLYFTLTV